MRGELDSERRKHAAERETFLSQIADLHDQLNGKEQNSISLQAEIASLQSEIEEQKACIQKFTVSGEAESAASTENSYQHVVSCSSNVCEYAFEGQRAMKRKCSSSMGGSGKR